MRNGEMKKMRKGSLLFVPSGGLANRMRAIASALVLTQQTGSRLQVVWFQDWALNAPFSSIFQPIDCVPLREATWADHLLYDRARCRNLYLPAVPQRLMFERHIKEQMVTPLKKQQFDFQAWATGCRCYMSCYQVFGQFPDTVYGKLFHPVKEVMQMVDSFRDHFSDHTIGLHIRRTDNAESIEKSPTALFVKKVEEEIDRHSDTHVFVATDDEGVKHELKERFGQRIITPSATASRNDIEGIRGGLADMYTLAATCHIYGSAGSSFSPMAASIGNTPLEIISL